MGKSLAHWGCRAGEGADGAGECLLDYATVAFGPCYRSAAIVGAPVDARPALPPAELTGQPGTRAPHVWLARDGERLSTIDLFGRHFVLLTGSDGASWIDAARSLPGIAVDAFRIGAGGELADPEGRWAAAYGVTAGGAVLVRPDGFVAWRAAQAAGDPGWALAAAFSELLARRPDPPGGRRAFTSGPGLDQPSAGVPQSSSTVPADRHGP
jgi:hypothetical protein